MNNNGQQRAAIRPGMTVDIVLKQDQPTGKLTRGVVKDLLTKSPNHPHGIKVRLQNGQVGRVKAIVDQGGSSAT
ncbi:YwbE family protein [Paenibacillus aurantiacus]|uniref:YwbE family protein n=1 Tax=Paenibacillus aurantiacus TaxID=1936118 RepID=A0ABV5KRV7_9BACL